MTNRELLMQRLLHDFQSAENFGIIESLVDGTSGVSLRLLDFFLCHYSLEHSVQYSLPDEPLPFHVHDEYSQMLTAYGKVHFDCFSRNKRAALTRGDKTIHTSAGQVIMFSAVNTHQSPRTRLYVLHPVLRRLTWCRGR